MFHHDNALAHSSLGVFVWLFISVNQRFIYFESPVNKLDADFCFFWDLIITFYRYKQNSYIHNELVNSLWYIDKIQIFLVTHTDVSQKYNRSTICQNVTTFRSHYFPNHEFFPPEMSITCLSKTVYWNRMTFSSGKINLRFSVPTEDRKMIT